MRFTRPGAEAPMVGGEPYVRQNSEVANLSAMIDTAIIPCGGRGTRLYPISRWVPKELLPVGLRPLLFWTLDEAAAAGLRRAIIVTNPEKPVLETAARAYPDALA